MDVELLVVDECPNEGPTAALLRRALDDVGLHRVPIRTRVVSSPQDAERLRFVGSPTVRIDGEDPFDTDDRRIGLSCRTYLTNSVRSGTPDLATIRQTLKRHADRNPAPASGAGCRTARCWRPVASTPPR